MSGGGVGLVQKSFGSVLENDFWTPHPAPTRKNRSLGNYQSISLKLPIYMPTNIPPLLPTVRY